MKIIPHSASVFGIPEWNAAKLPGYDLDAADTRLSPVLPHYLFRKEIVRLLSFVWGREITRAIERNRLGMLLTGPKGAGKTTAVEQFFTRLRVPVFHYTANRATEIADLLESRTLIDGSIVAVEGPLLTAMRMGCPFVLNELDLMDPAVLTGLNDIIERGLASTSTGVVLAARGFVFFATTNGVGDETGSYGGTNVMNQALISRFITARVNFPTEEEEVTVLTTTIKGLLKTVAGKMVKVATAVRDAEALATTMSTRELITWGELMVAFAELGKQGEDVVALTLNATMGDGCDSASRETLHQIAQRVFGGRTASQAST